MARPPVHGAKQLAQRVALKREGPRVRRSIARRARALEANTPAAAAAIFRRRIATREEIALPLEAHLAAHPDAKVDHKWLVSLWNAQRRDLEVLALLDAQRRAAPDMLTCAKCRTAYAPHEYARHACRPTSPPDAATPLAASHPAAVAAPAAAGPTDEDADG